MFLRFATFYTKIAEQVGCLFKAVTDIFLPQNYFCGGSIVSYDSDFLFLEWSLSLCVNSFSSTHLDFSFDWYNLLCSYFLLRWNISEKAIGIKYRSVWTVNSLFPLAQSLYISLWGHLVSVCRSFESLRVNSLVPMQERETWLLLETKKMMNIYKLSQYFCKIPNASTSNFKT